MRISLLTVVLTLTMIQPCLGSGGSDPSEDSRPKETRESITDGFVGGKVPPFSGRALSGAELSSTEHGARALIISLWSLNCGSCLEEMKALEPIFREFSGQGLRIWAVNTEEITANEIRSGLKSRGVDVGYELVPDPGLKITKLFTKWFIPVTILVDREGIVQYYKIGFNEADAEKIKAKVGALLAQ